MDSVADLHTLFLRNNKKFYSNASIFSCHYIFGSLSRSHFPAASFQISAASLFPSGSFFWRSFTTTHQIPSVYTAQLRSHCLLPDKASAKVLTVSK